MESVIWVKCSLDEAKSLFAEYDDLEFTAQNGWVMIDDLNHQQLFGLAEGAWIDIAGGYELVRAYYDEQLNTEYVHVKDGAVVLCYFEYEGEVDKDTGNDGVSIESWSDVADYIDEHTIYG